MFGIDAVAAYLQQSIRALWVLMLMCGFHHNSSSR